MNQETRYSGHWIVAAQGTGKTTLLLHMLATDLKKNASIIILDAKGELTTPIRRLHLDDRLIVIDPKNPIAINPLDVSKTNLTRAVDQLLYIFGALLDADVTAKQEAFLRPVLRALTTCHAAPTLAVLQSIINSPRGPIDQFAGLPADLEEFFRVEWADYAATRGELKWRMRLLLENDLIRSMFTSPRSRFHISDAMDSGKVVVVDNSQAVVGKTGSSFLGRYIISQVWEAATARATRSQSDKLPVYIYIDEANLLIDEKIAAIIDECRSQRIALILAHQRASQILDKNVLGALENCAIKMANVDAEAYYFSKLLHIPEERINQLPRGHFASHVRGEGSSIIEITPASLPYRDMTVVEQQQHRQTMHSLFAASPSEPPSIAQADTPPPAAHLPVETPCSPPTDDDQDSASEWR